MPQKPATFPQDATPARKTSRSAVPRRTSALPADPVCVARRTSLFNPGLFVLFPGMAASGFYALGHLTGVNHLLDHAQPFARAHSMTVDSSFSHWMPIFLVFSAALLLMITGLVTFFKSSQPATVSRTSASRGEIPARRRSDWPERAVVAAGNEPRNSLFDSVATLPADLGLRRNPRPSLQENGRTILPPAVIAAMQVHISAASAAS